jgi:hypothetical protein
MRTILLSVSALLPLVAACGGDDGGGTNTQPVPEGTHYHMVVNSIHVPATTNEARSDGLDLGTPTSNKQDGTVDNQLGNVLSALKGQGFDVQGTLDIAVSHGSLALLVDFQTKDFSSASASGLEVLFASTAAGAITPAPCTDANDTVCGHHLDGTGTFMVDANSPTDALVSGPIVGGTFNGGPGEITLQLALGGTTPVDLDLHGARGQASGVSDSGITSGILAGALSQDDLNNKVIPAIQSQLVPIIARDCPYANTTNSCACNQCQAAAGDTDAGHIAACTAHTDMGSCTGDTANGCTFDSSTTGKTILGLFDTAPKDCMVTSTEIQNNTLIKSLLAPDVCIESSCAKPDALSLGVKFTAVKGTYTVAGE